MLPAFSVSAYHHIAQQIKKAADGTSLFIRTSRHSLMPNAPESRVVLLRLSFALLPILATLALLLNCHHSSDPSTSATHEASNWTFFKGDGQQVHNEELRRPVIELRYQSGRKGGKLARKSGMILSELDILNGALLLEVKSEEFTQFDVAVKEGDGSLYDYLLVIPNDGKWHKRILPLRDFVLNVRTSRDKNVKLDLDELTDEVLLFDHPGFMRRDDFANTLSIGRLESASVRPPPRVAIDRSKVLQCDANLGERELRFSDYLNKVEGAWIGKLAGGALGLATEARTREEIKEKYGDITDYLVPVNGFQADDDTTFQICALSCFRENGLNLDSVTLAHVWQERMSPDYLWMGPREGMLNIVENNILPPLSGKTRWGEMLCAAIRADIYGLISPGMPKVARLYARADAEIDHYGEGVHAAAFTACATSLAFFEAESPGKASLNDIQRLLSTTLNYIPKGSQYAKMIETMIALRDRGKTEDEAYQFVKSSYYDPLYAKDPQYAWAYALPNGGLVTLSLLYGEGDFEDSITLAAELGWDTDCNAAAVGSILGAMIGASAIPDKWSSPLNNRFRAAVAYSENWDISELAKKIAQVGVRVVESRRK